MFPPLVGGLVPYSHPQVTGLTLTVTAGEDVSRVLRFDKLETPVINIGRMPSSRASEPELDLDLDLAWFRCAVVSRKHAKICFADSGHVYLIDLSSHHGTHLLKVGHAVPVALAPEVPTPLADGDFITFGKSVGKDADLVRPVIVRVKFLLEPADRSEMSQPIHIQRSNSGRFGVMTDIDSSSSSSDSEVEEVDPPDVLPSNPYRIQIPSQSISHGFGFIEQWFRSDPSHPNTQPQLQPHLSLHSQPPPLSEHEDAPSSSSSMAKEVINVDDYDDSQLVMPYRTTQIFTHHTDMSIPPSSAAIMSPIPIDLEDTIDNIVVEPSLVGAWPPSPRSPIDHDEFVVSLMDNMDGGEVDMNLESDVEDSLDNQVAKAPKENSLHPQINAPEEIADATRTPELLHPVDAVDLIPGGEAIAPQTAPATLKVLEDIKEDLDSIKENVRQVSSDVWELQKSQQNTSTSVWDINRRVDSLDLRIKAMESAHETNYGKLSAMLEKEASRVDEVLRKCEEEKEEAKKTCKTLMEEMQSLREQTDKQMSTEVEALKVAQKEALDAVRVMTHETQIACTSHLNNLKRKRDELEEEEEAERAMKMAKFSKTRVATNIAKGASIFTAGVIATWSALAFS